VLNFTVITVCRNSQATIARTLESVRAQVGVQVQHVIIDGASSDNTLAVIRGQTPQTGVVISEPDNGIYDAMNKGITRATGDIIGLLNADDHYAHDAVLRDIARTFDTGYCDVVFGDVGFFKPGHPGHIVRRYNSGRFSPKRIGFGIMPAHPATFMRRQVYDRFGPFKTDYNIAADFEFIARIFKSDDLRYRYLPEILVKMQAGGVSTSGLGSVLKLNKEILRACRENDITSSPFHLACKVPYRLLELIRK
jgi:glycosyltransferase involved in cell wall biosynthesis